MRLLSIVKGAVYGRPVLVVLSLGGVNPLPASAEAIDDHLAVNINGLKKARRPTPASVPTARRPEWW